MIKRIDSSMLYIYLYLSCDLLCCIAKVKMRILFVIVISLCSCNFKMWNAFFYSVPFLFRKLIWWWIWKDEQINKIFGWDTISIKCEFYQHLNFFMVLSSFPNIQFLRIKSSFLRIKVSLWDYMNVDIELWIDIKIFIP